MAKVWLPKSSIVLNNWLDKILAESHRLNDWECTFIASIAVRVKNNIALTESQEEKLEHIYAEKTS